MRAGRAGTRDPGPGAREGQGEGQRVHSDQRAQPSLVTSSSGSQEQQHSHPDHGADPGSSDSRLPIPDSQLHLYYGGTFDPIHLGHLAIACAARGALGVVVHVVPAADPPHRSAPGATAPQRAQMLTLALAGQPGLVLDTRELQRACASGAPSYTVETLRELRATLGPQTPIAWLLGADAFVELSQWHEWEALFGLAHFVIAARPGTALDLADSPALAAAVQGRWATSVDELSASPAGRLWRLQASLRGESASAVRARIASGGDWRALVPAAVADFIAQQGLYGCACPAS
ncbi:nicotinate-nucleotide adenylyltransferase [Xanthomonas cucurbitae]|uniref:Probable nicotinate-nucleotide adenylyltransferase n=1 Tax=Xanthomonas cucurbitae TaxID=56453 RepID=A0A2S7DQ09_9XANT|nr:nicotinate-nucleotide adenylyltransferase [Xanthomonas cucurbitae]PPU75840.1 nicotinic acid mononucleotide adenylyltransferase [Xanthomonas cucurbitae]WDM66415.1 nicotinate-nucleotide adenylyltransferase [Xanthomonas cucurbitae]WDM70293.1 nicotinate-nucleotide adenylyltransferase [Xanthomonas cucurbitae]WDM80406.1 nicotinate-nucleotide adenylyltransferase [Xanthomonas cucurbitae]WDM84095.1 nicotinate-nucleotide adenylyltransferase [Xanthomonas cucurbitae]